MRDLLLQAAGVIAILVSIAHGVIGETKVFARGTIHHGETLTAEAEGVFIQGSMQRLAERVDAAARDGAK